MADAYTGTTAMSNLVKAAYDRYVEFALRSQPLFRNLADKRPVQQAMPGSTVVFSLYQDLAASTGTLTEATDPDAVAVSNTTNVTVTLNEYGNVVLETKKLGEFAFSDVDPAIANLVAYNMADSIDQVVVSTLIGGTNVLYGGDATATNELVVADVITGSMIRKSVSKMRAGNSVPREGMLYAAYMHPEVAYDLRGETGALSFEDIRKYTDPNVGNVLNATTGVYGGAYVVETPRAYVATDGAGSIQAYRTIIAGAQALAEATAVEPGIVQGPIVDKLMRARPLGWYSLQGWAIYRQDSLYRLETSSSIA
jgi:N4-gp56 family major capsid protein